MLIIRALGVVLIISLVSCALLKSPTYLTFPPNPFPDIKSVAILPFTSYARELIDGEEFASVFASELIKFPGFKVITPAQVKLAMKKPLASLEDAIMLAKDLKADALIVGAIKDYDPYYPPGIVVFIEVISTKKYITERPRDISRLLQSASWEKAPVRITKKEEAEYLVCSFDKNYDTRDVFIRQEVQAYALSQYHDTAFEDEREFLNVQERFWEFVSNQIIREIYKYSPGPSGG